MPRRIQDLAVRVAPTSARLTQRMGRSPTLRQLATQLDATEEDVAIALHAWQAQQWDSLDVVSAPGADGRRPLIDTVGALDAGFDTVVDRSTLQPLLAALPMRERRILAMRYFGDLTQAEIAIQIGVSQMQVSRLLVRTLTHLRTSMLAEHPVRSAHGPSDHLTSRRPGARDPCAGRLPHRTVE